MKFYCSLIGFAMLSGHIVAQPTRVQQLPQDRGQSLPPSVEFFAANPPRTWAVTAEVTGRAERDGDVLRLYIKTCSLFRPERFSDPVNFVYITSGISRIRPRDTWEILRRSERHFIRQSLTPGKGIDLEPFELAIPLQGFALEDNDRLTFQVWNISERNGEKHGGHVPVHASVHWPDAFFWSNNAEASRIAQFRSYAASVSDRIDGEIDGRISQQSEALTIRVDSGVLSSSEEYPDDRRHIEAIQVLIMRSPEYGKRAIERTGESHAVGQDVKPGATVALQPFELKLPLANYSSRPTDALNLRVISVTSDGLRESTYLHVPYQLPLGQSR
ncbi:MAG TPA: hypothetical protein VK752_13760 [Bryobacteraceae bacterium]|nr:hypothetical protein [Bryobacteraceae bacterium]